MRINGTLINYYVHCKRQCYLHYHRIGLEDNSELVKIGKALHAKNAEEEVAVEGIKIDKITRDYIVEVKKSDADMEAAKYQLLYYLKVAFEKGFSRKGKLVCLEKNHTNETTMIYIYDEHKDELENMIIGLENLIESDVCPKPCKANKCKKCAYYMYCYI